MSVNVNSRFNRNAFGASSGSLPAQGLIQIRVNDDLKPLMNVSPPRLSPTLGGMHGGVNAVGNNFNSLLARNIRGRVNPIDVAKAGDLPQKSFNFGYRHGSVSIPQTAQRDLAKSTLNKLPSIQTPVARNGQQPSYFAAHRKSEMYTTAQRGSTLQDFNVS